MEIVMGFFLALVTVIVVSAVYPQVFELLDAVRRTAAFFYDYVKSKKDEENTDKDT